MFADELEALVFADELGVLAPLFLDVCAAVSLAPRALIDARTRLRRSVDVFPRIVSIPLLLDCFNA